MVNSNIELVRKDRIGEILYIVVALENVWVADVRQRIERQNQLGDRTDSICWNGVIGKGHSVDIRDVGNTVEVAIPHSLGGHCPDLGSCGPIPHSFVVGKKERMVLKDGATQGTPERVCTLGRLCGVTSLKSIERLILEVLK